MGSWWTPAHDEAAKHLAKKIKEAKEAGNKAAEEQAWRDYDQLHGVKFGLVFFDAADKMVGEPIMLFIERDADTYLGQTGQGQPPAVKATLHPHEAWDRTLKTWTWDGASRGWKPA